MGWRGYGGNPGDPTEDGLYADGRAALDYLRGLGIPSSRQVAYGESLGSAVAVELARETGFGAVVLEAPFTSIVDIAQAIYRFVPVRPLVRDRFESLEKISRVSSPLLVIHGEVRVDGRVRGEILGAAVLEIGETGEVEASIEADEVLVAGSFRGEIRAHRRVELRATARVQGSIETPRLVLEEGSLLDGRCRAGSAPSDALAAAGKPSETRGSSS